MDLVYGSEARNAFATNIGLVTSNGPHGHDIMAAEWTFQVSYNPPLMAVCIGPGKATLQNIEETGVFGLGIAASDQNVLSSIAGGYTAKKTDKIGLLQEIGIGFRQAKDSDVLLPEGAVLLCECTVVETHTLGDHITIIGEAKNIEYNPSKNSLIYHQGKYVAAGDELPKPSSEERENWKKIAEKYDK